MKRRIFRVADDGHIGALARLLSQVTQAGKVLRVTVEPWRKPRSLQQNAYYHAVIVDLIATDTGHSPAEIHEILKDMYCPVRIVRLGDVERQVRSTTLLSTVEMSGYIEQCIAFAAVELGISVPAAGEYA
jgi:hypothetical protein